MTIEQQAEQWQIAFHEKAEQLKKAVRVNHPDYTDNVRRLDNLEVDFVMLTFKWQWAMEDGHTELADSMRARIGEMING